MRDAPQRCASHHTTTPRNATSTYFSLRESQSLNTLIPYAKNGADLQALASVLDRLAVGDVVTYVELSAAIGRDIQKHRYLLDKAQDRLLKQRKVFGCVHHLGMKRLSDAEIVEHSFYAFRRIRRMARKSATRLTSVEWSDLAEKDKQRHNLHLSVLGAITHAATPKNMTKNLEMACKNSQQQGLPTAQTLRLLAS